MEKILVVTTYIPQFDRNAGDRRVYDLCCILSKSYKVYILPIYFNKSTYKYIPELEKKKIRVIIPWIMDNIQLKDKIKKLNFTSVIFEWPESIEHYFDTLKYIPIKIADVHELRYLRIERMTKIGCFNKRLVKKYKDDELNLYKKVDILITVSDEENRVLKKELPTSRVHTITSCVDIKTKINKNYSERKDLVYFASFAINNKSDSGLSCQNEDAVGYFYSAIYPLIMQKIPNVKLHLLGTNADKLMIKNNVIKKSHIECIEKELGKFRVFVYSLRFGAGIKKKLLDAAVSGTPIVTTSIGINGMKFKNGYDVLVADTPGKFVESVLNLYNDKTLWNKLSSNAFKTVKKYYSMKTMIKEASKLKSYIKRYKMGKNEKKHIK